MTKVTVTRTTSKGVKLDAQIDNEDLTFKNDKAIVELDAGEQALTWQVVGKKGDTYSIDLESEDGASCSGSSPEGGLDNTGADEGGCKFVITGGD